MNDNACSLASCQAEGLTPPLDQGKRTRWGEKPYYSLDYYLKEQFGEKVYRLSLHAGLTCPNRDGTLHTRGCLFCSRGGSGDFAASPAQSITRQIETAKSLVAKKSRCRKFIAYFQAYTNTYGPLSYLRKIFFEAITHPDIVALSIATRPDCLSPEILELLQELNNRKPVWIELGLQTIHEDTHRLIRSGFTLSCFQDAVTQLHKIHIPVIVHVILGLPNETREMMLQTVSYLSALGIEGIKLQLLHILKDTDLADYYKEQPFLLLSCEEYCELVADCLNLLKPDIVVHRLTGDGPRDLLIAPLWSRDKKRVLNQIHKVLKNRQSYQGKELTSMAEALTQYKLIVLYMLERVDFPLTNTQISNFILEKEYTTYFTLQQAISELISAELIRTESTHNNTHYHITPAGRETLSYFPDKISAAIKNDVITYFEANQMELKNEITVLADFYKTTDTKYAARCQIKESEQPVIDLTIKAGNKEQAEAICRNWQNRNEEVYAFLMDTLMC